MKTWENLTVGDRLVKKEGKFVWQDEIEILALSGKLMAYRSHMGNIVWFPVGGFENSYDIMQDIEETEKEPPLLIQGSVHGSPRFLLELNGNKPPELMKDVNILLKRYGIKICWIKELHNSSVDEALNRGDGTYKP